MTGAETRGLFFSDVEGSTALALRLGDRFDDLLDRHRALMRAAFVAHGGTEHGTEGDSFFVTFPTAAAAVRAAIDAQRALLAEAWTPGDEVRVRMGVHVGAVRQHGTNDLTGVDIHLAARVMSTGHGGQIVVTRGVVDQLLGSDIDTRSLGEHQLKDIPRRTELFQVEADGLPTDFPPLRGVGRADVIRLPRIDKAFFGRDSEFKTGLALVNDKRAVTLVGPPGAGKTRLALELAWQAQAGFAQAAFVDLAAVESDERVAQTAATACGVGGGSDPVGGLVAFSADVPTLLVLDNCEHVVRGAAALVAALVEQAPALTVLATSQVPLGVSAEALLPIGPLEDASSDGQLCAVQLFAERAAALGSPVDETQADDVLAIVERLDRIPLAVELAASLTPTLSPREIAERLADRFRLLADLDSGPERRHATLLQALASSFERLGDDERKMAGRLAVCVGQFNFDTIEGLAADLEIEAVLPVVHRLVRLSWLVREQAPAGSRYRMLESLREFARRDAGEKAWEESRCAHARYFLGRHADADPEDFPNDYAAFAEVDEEISNVVAAIDWAAASGEQLDPAAATALRLYRYFQSRPDWRNTRALFGRLLEAGTKGDMARALLSQVMGVFAFLRSMADGVDEPELVAAAQAMAEESGEPRARMRAAHFAGQRAGRRREPNARRATDHLIELAIAYDNPRFHEMGLYWRAATLLATEGLDACEADLLKALAISKKIGDASGVAFAANALVDIEFGRGNAPTALEYARAALVAAEESGHGVSVILSKACIAQLTLDPEELLSALEGLLVDARRLGTKTVEGDVYVMLAGAARLAGDLDAAAGYLATFDAAGGVGMRYARVGVEVERAKLARAQGDPDRARALMRDELAAMRIQEERASAWDLVGLLAHWGLAHADPVVNREIELSAVTAYRQFGDPRHPRQAAEWRADHPDLAAGTDTPMSLEEAVIAILDDER